MGSRELEGFPKTPPFRKVVARIGVGAGFAGSVGIAPGTVADIATATLEASFKGFERAKNDDGLAFAFYLLAQLTRAARQEDFQAALAHIGVAPPKVAEPMATTRDAPSSYDIYDLIASYTATVDRELRARQHRTDIGEIGQQAAAESIAALCRPKSLTLFGSTIETVQDSLQSLSTKKGFANLCQDFFARFTQRYLLYHLSRELSNHVGEGRRFQSTEDHNAFRQEIGDYCQARSRILRKFAGEWYDKADREAGISVRMAKGFVAHAIDKMRMAIENQGADDVG